MDPFRHQAKQYVLSRPRYPPLFLDKIRARTSPSMRRKCLDVGCGSGQLTVALADVFDHVVGVDRSKPQLLQAVKHDRVEYLPIEDAVNLGQFESDSFDCVTIAQALHWLPLKQSLAEFNRVLRPGGIFAAMGYGICRVDSSPTVQSVFQDYYVNTLGSELSLTDPRCKWDCDRRRLDTGHAAEIFSPPFIDVERLWYEDKRTVSDRDFISYMITWSAYQKLVKTDEPKAQDPLNPIRAALDKEKRDLEVVFPFWLIIGSKPSCPL